MSNARCQMSVFVLGPEGSFSDEAAKILRGKYALKYASSFSEIFKEVERGNLGFAPVRNKIIGEIRSISKFLKTGQFEKLKIFRTPISFVLVAKKKTDFGKIRAVYCSKIAHAQCRKFIKKNLERAKIVSNFPSTSSAFKKIVQLRGKRVDLSATIGSSFAAKLCNLRVLAKNIQDDNSNWTEFVLFKKQRGKQRKKQPKNL